MATRGRVLGVGLGTAAEAAGEVLGSPGQGQHSSPVSSQSTAEADVGCRTCHSVVSEEHPFGWNNKVQVREEFLSIS